MKIAIVVAMSTNRVIGRDNKLPWHIPGDLKFFKRTTMGKPVVMGRKTFESIGKPLPGRDNIVITRQRDWRAEGVRVVHDIQDALKLARDLAETAGADEVAIIGGAEIYREILEQVDRLYVTQVQAWIEGDAIFPEVDWEEWQETSREDFDAEDPNPFDYSIIVYDRLRQ